MSKVVVQKLDKEMLKFAKESSKNTINSVEEFKETAAKFDTVVFYPRFLSTSVKVSTAVIQLFDGLL